MPAERPPAELAARDQWVCWRNECRECSTVYDPEIKTCPECDENTTKRPINSETGQFAKADDPGTWGTYEAAVEFDAENDTHGVGFMFREDGDIVGIDLDDCRDPETGEIDDWAIEIIETLASFVEISPSGTGLHIYVYGELPEGGNRKGDVEMYDKERYFTVTGDTIPRSHSTINYRQGEVEAVHAKFIRGEDRGTTGGTEIVDYDLGDHDVGEEVQYTNDLGESIEEIRDRDDKLDALLTTLEPSGYESTSEADMAAVSKLWFWRFARDDIAGIVRTYRARGKVLDRDDYLELTIGKAANGEQYDPYGHIDDDIEILDDRDVHHSITDSTLPKSKHFVLDKPPREGGSHASIKHLSQQPLVALVSRHAIGEHHLGILEEVMPEGKTAIHFTGRRRACEHAEKDECPNAVSEFEELFQLENEAKDIVHRKRVVTHEDAPERFCNHQFLRYAEKYSHAVVTVPQLLQNLETDPETANLLIDEEQALAYFRPGSTELVEVKHVYEPDGRRSVQIESSNIGKQFGALERIHERIMDDQQQRKEESEDDVFRRTQVEIDLVNAIEYLANIKRELGVSTVVEEMTEADEKITTKAVLDELRDRLNSLDRPEPRVGPDEFREKLSEYTSEFYHNDELDPGSLIEATLYPYDARPFDFKKTGPAHTLRMIGGREIFHPELLRSFNQIGIIAGPEGELFFDDLDMDAKTVYIDSFRYDSDFVVVPVGRTNQDNDKDPEKPETQRRKAKRVSKILNRRAHPHIAVAGTKHQARSHHSDLTEGMADIVSNPESPAKDLRTLWGAGQTAIIYANSSVSRGIDAPFFDVTTVASAEFATPYWEARKAHWQGEDEDEYAYAAAIESQLKSRELTNAVLRQSTTRGTEPFSGTKFIVVASWDARRLKYLGERKVPEIKSPETAANFVENLTIGGGFRQAIDSLHNEVGGDEREFIEIAMQYDFTEDSMTRPRFDLDELTRWAENGYLLDEDTMGTMEGVLPKGAGVVSPTAIRNVLDQWNPDRIMAALSVMQRTGSIRYVDNGDEGGSGGWERV